MSLQNKVLVGALVLQAIILIIVFWPSSSSLGSGKLVAGLEDIQVTSVTISDSNANSIRLAHGPFGCVLPDADDFPCRTDKLTSFINRLVGLNTASLVAQTGESHRRLKVSDDEFVRTIDIQRMEGAPLRLYLGTSPRHGSVHVRSKDRNEVYLESTLAVSEASPRVSDWVDVVYFSVPQEQVVALTQENSQGLVQLEKNEGGEWALPEESLNETLAQWKAQSLVRKISSLRMHRPLGKEQLESYDLENPNAVLTIRTLADDGSSGELVLTIGAIDEQEDAYVVKSSESPYYVLMKEFVVRELVENGNKDLLEPPPEETPEPAA